MSEPEWGRGSALGRENLLLQEQLYKLQNAPISLRS